MQKSLFMTSLPYFGFGLQVYVFAIARNELRLTGQIINNRTRIFQFYVLMLGRKGRRNEVQG